MSEERQRMPTLPDAQTESHAELDPRVRVRARTTTQEHDRRETIDRWLADDEWTRRLMGRIYDVLEEQTLTNVRTSRLERQRSEDVIARSDLLAQVRASADAVMVHVDKASIGRRHVRLREVAVLVIALAGAVASVIAAAQGRHVELPAIEAPHK
jgi:hypothetical protein